MERERTIANEGSAWVEGMKQWCSSALAAQIRQKPSDKRTFTPNDSSGLMINVNVESGVWCS